MQNGNNGWQSIILASRGLLVKMFITLESHGIFLYPQYEVYSGYIVFCLFCNYVCLSVCLFVNFFKKISQQLLGLGF